MKRLLAILCFLALSGCGSWTSTAVQAVQSVLDDYEFTPTAEIGVGVHISARGIGLDAGATFAGVLQHRDAAGKWSVVYTLPTMAPGAVGGYELIADGKVVKLLRVGCQRAHELWAVVGQCPSNISGFSAGPTVVWRSDAKP